MTEESTETPRPATRKPRTKKEPPESKKVVKGQENLIPVNTRTKEEAREISVRGGIASGKTRRAQKTFREIFISIMDVPVKEAQIDEIANLPCLQGLDKRNFVVKDIIALQQAQKAMNGDTRAYEAVRDSIGEIIDMKLKMEIDMKADEAKLANLKKLLDENPELRDKLLK